MHDKPKRQSYWKEISFGSITLLIASPLIAFALVYATMALIAGLSYLSQGEAFAPSLITAAGLGIVGLTFALWQVIQRFRQVIRPQRESYINHHDNIYDDISSAERRLMDIPQPSRPLSHNTTASKKHFIQG